MSNNSTATTVESKERVMVTDRIVTFKDPKKILLPVVGTFPAECFSSAFLGTYTSRFDNDGEIEYLDYVRLGFGFIYVDKNTGEEQQVFAEVSLTDKRESRIHQMFVLPLNDGNDEAVDFSSFVGKKATITVIHKPSTLSGKVYAQISEVVAVDQSIDVGTDASDKYIFFDIATDYSDSNPTDNMKMLPKKHLWFIENRSNEFGLKPFTQEVYEQRAAEIAAQQASQAEAKKEPATA